MELGETTASSAPPVYTPTSDPVEFDRTGTEWFIKEASGAIESGISLISSRQSLFSSVQPVVAEATDIELIYRQCTPAVLMGKLQGWEVDELAEYIFLYARWQTLILNNIDRHLDLSSSYTIRDPNRLLRDVRVMLTLGPLSMHMGIAEVRARDEISLSRCMRAMSRTTSVILESMLDNYLERFNRVYLEDPNKLISIYLSDARSRHLGSGFYSSSIEGAYAFFGSALPDGLDAILRSMRKLRQRIDELSDLYEDTMTGLVSYPVCLGLVRDNSGTLATHVESAWAAAKASLDRYTGDASSSIKAILESPLLNERFVPIHDLLASSGVLDDCAEQARVLAHDIIDQAYFVLEAPLAEVVRFIVHLKLAYLDRLVQQDFADDPPAHSLLSLRKDILERSVF